MKFHPLKSLTAVALAGVVLLGSCAENTGTPGLSNGQDTSAVSGSGTVKLDGQIVSIPSPTLLAILLRKANVSFDPAAVHPVAARTNYLSEQRKALALGVYGADLAYVASFEQGQLNSDYFGAVGALAMELDILDHIDKGLVARVNNNLSDRDSLVSLNAEFFHAADKYLKSTERGDLSGLILIGGWIEALHLSSGPAMSNADIRFKVAEQKYAAKSILSLLDRAQGEAMEPIREEMRKLAELFSALESTYKYAKPITDSKEKVTYFTSKTSVMLSDDELVALAAQVKAVRTLILQ